MFLDLLIKNQTNEYFNGHWDWLSIDPKILQHNMAQPPNFLKQRRKLYEDVAKYLKKCQLAFYSLPKKNALFI